MTQSSKSRGTALRRRMTEDMILAGLSPRTRQTYIAAVRSLAAEYKRSPDLISEAEVQAYLLKRRHQGAARGSFKASHYGIRFLYCQTLNRDWALFGKKIRQPRQKRLPEALTDDQIRQLLGAITNAIHRGCFLLMYACGLRIM